MKRIDSHAHIIPAWFIQEVRDGSYPNITLRQLSDGREMFSFGGNLHPCTPLFWNLTAQLAFMDQKKISRQAISVSPRLFFYEWEPQTVAVHCRRCNNSLLTLERESNGRLLAVGGLPMQSISDTLQEIDYLHSRKVCMVQIGTTIGDRCLDDEQFVPVYQKIAKYKMVLLLHPLIGNDVRTPRYHAGNTVGNPYQTTAAAVCLIFSGVLDRVPDLKVLLVHGGGFLPYQIGRMDHAFRVRPQWEHRCSNEPSYYLRRNFWSDGLTHDAGALRYLIETMGPDRVVYGTDYPYDMADYEQVDHLLDPGIPADWAKKLACENFEKILEK